MVRNLVSLCIFGAFLVIVLPDTTQAQKNVVDIIGKPMFNVAVLKSRKPAIVFYYSSACQSCENFLLPSLENMAGNKKGLVRVFKVDLDKVDLKEEHGIDRIPTTMTYYQGDPFDVAEGPFWGKMVALINKAAKLE